MATSLLRLTAWSAGYAAIGRTWCLGSPSAGSQSQDRKADQRSAEAAEYRKLYNTARWRDLRAYLLAMQPLCERCLLSETVEVATVVHHKDGGHRGDIAKFWDGPFENLCAPHHDREGKLEDHGRTVINFGPDGWPL